MNTCQAEQLDGLTMVRRQWEAPNAEKNVTTWSDRPVLFERIEIEFIIQRCQSPLMYLHNRPSLARIRRARDSGSDLLQPQSSGRMS